MMKVAGMLKFQRSFFYAFYDVYGKVYTREKWAAEKP